MRVPFQAEGRQSKHRNRVTKHLQAFPRQGKTHGGSVSCLRSAAPITEDDCQTSHCNEQSAVSVLAETSLREQHRGKRRVIILQPETCQERFLKT